MTDFWFKKLDKETESIRIDINGLLFKAEGKSLHILSLTFILMICALFLSGLQPIYVADKIAIITSMLLCLEAGIFGGLVMSERLITETYKVHALKGEKKT